MRSAVGGPSLVGDGVTGLASGSGTKRTCPGKIIRDAILFILQISDGVVRYRIAIFSIVSRDPTSTSKAFFGLSNCLVDCRFPRAGFSAVKAEDNASGEGRGGDLPLSSTLTLPPFEERALAEDEERSVGDVLATPLADEELDGE